MCVAINLGINERTGVDGVAVVHVNIGVMPSMKLDGLSDIVRDYLALLLGYLASTYFCVVAQLMEGKIIEAVGKLRISDNCFNGETN
jgi:hypothetical protein